MRNAGADMDDVQTMLADPDLCKQQSDRLLYYKRAQLRETLKQNKQRRVAAVKGARVMYEVNTGGGVSQNKQAQNKRQRVTPSRARIEAPRDGGRKPEDTTLPDYAKVPAVTLKNLIKEFMRDPANMIMNPRECAFPGCPYCTGCIMRQRYELAKRLVQIEFRLYGHQLELDEMC